MAGSRSFSEAAVKNGITQSAVSQAVRQIEKRLGAQLVDRTTRPLQLTEEGQVFYEGCRAILDQYDSLQAQIRRSGEIHQTTVRVSAIYSVGLRDMNRYIDAFAKAYPGATVHIDYAHTDKVYEKVHQGSSDIGLVAWPKKGRDLVTVPWRTEEMVIVCATSHPLASRNTVSPGKLRGQRFVGFDRGTVIRQRIDRFLRAHGVQTDAALEFDNIENVKQAVEAGSGIALLPWPTVIREVDAGTLAAVRVAEARFTRPLGVVRRRTKIQNALVDRFIDLLRQPEDGSQSRSDAPPSKKATK